MGVGVGGGQSVGGGCSAGGSGRVLRWRHPPSPPCVSVGGGEAGPVWGGGGGGEHCVLECIIY